jgi:hypothetical protein
MWSIPMKISDKVKIWGVVYLIYGLGILSGLMIAYEIWRMGGL